MSTTASVFSISKRQKILDKKLSLQFSNWISKHNTIGFTVRVVLNEKESNLRLTSLTELFSPEESITRTFKTFNHFIDLSEKFEQIRNRFEKVLKIVLLTFKPISMELPRSTRQANNLRCRCYKPFL